MANDNDNKFKAENADLKKQIADLENTIASHQKALLAAHRMTWLIRLTPKSATQAEANRLIDVLRDAVGRETADALEREWRGVKPKAVEDSGGV